MKTEVMLDMNESSALVTVAMLSTMLNERHVDYLDLISPFVLTLIPTKVGERVNTEKIVTPLREQYGFEQFPIHVLTKILTRYSKEKYGYLEKKRGEFYVKKRYEHKNFVDNQQKIREIQCTVMEKLQTYLQENSKYKNIQIDRTRELFLLFLEKKGLAFVDGVAGLREVTRVDYDLYHVARFVLEEFNKKSSIYHHIEEIVRGFFVYKSIYFFSREGIETINKKMKDTLVFLDTRLLIEALGYNTQEGLIAIRELISLIREQGGCVKTFSHLVQEVDNILGAYSKANSKVSFSLHYLFDNNYNEVDIQRLRSSLKTKLRELNIDIIDPISSYDLGNDEYTPLQVNDLTHAIQVAYGLITRAPRSDNDVLSVATIYSLRNNARCTSFEDCRAIMVTANLGFVAAVHDFYEPSEVKNFPFVVSDIEITSALWLNSWDKKSSLPSIILLENAYASCQPTPDLLMTFNSTIEKLRKEGTLSEEEALLLRTQRAPREELLDISQNDVGYINEKTVLEIKDRYIDSLTKQQNAEIDKLKIELQKQRDDKEQRKHNAIENVENNAQAAADKIEKRLNIGVKIVFFALMLLGIIAIIINQISSTGLKVWDVILMAVGILGLFDYMWSQKSLIKRRIKIIKNDRFAKVQEQGMQTIYRDFY